MIFSKITTFGILLASLSKSVCGNTEIRNSHIDALLKQHQQRHPLSRDYIKPDGRRRADETTNIICRLWEKSMIANLNSQWECSFNDPGISMDFDGHSKKAIVGVDGEYLNEWLERNGAVSGMTMMVLSDAEVLTDRIIIDKANVIAIDEYHHNSINRRLQSATGILNTLVVRVNTPDSSPPEATVLSEDIFSDEYSLKTQFDRCSFGKLQIQKYETESISELCLETITDAPGVVDIFVEANAEGALVDDFEFLAESAFKNMLDITQDPGDLFRCSDVLYAPRHG
jgi:hypothetical protein